MDESKAVENLGRLTLSVTAGYAVGSLLFFLAIVLAKPTGLLVLFALDALLWIAFAVWELIVGSIVALATLVLWSVRSLGRVACSFHQPNRP